MDAVAAMFGRILWNGEQLPLSLTTPADTLQIAIIGGFVLPYWTDEA